MTRPHAWPLVLLLVGIAGAGLAATNAGGLPPEAPDAARAGMIAGSVLDPDGKPLKDATVTCHPAENSSFWEYVPPIATTTTGPDGAFGLADLGPGDYVLLARSDGLADGFATCRVQRGQGLNKLTIHLEPAMDIMGRVADSAGKPVEGVRLHFVRELSEAYLHSRPITTGADGSFRFTYAPLEGVELSAQKDGCNEWSGYVAQAASRARKKPYSIVLIRQPVVTGLVMNAETREPVADATVYCMQSEEPVKADGNGRYRVTFPAPGEKQFAAVAPGLATPSLRKTIAYDDKIAELDLAMRPATPIKGLVVDRRSGRPIKGAAIEVGLRFPQGELDEPTDRTLHIPGHDEPIPIPEGRSIFEVLRGSISSPIRAVSDARGRFIIPLSFPRMAALHIVAQDYLEDSFDLTRADLSKELVIKLNEGGVISGRVLGPDGKPAAGLPVVCGIGYLAEERTTDAHGRFRFGGLYTTDFAQRHALAAVDRDKPRAAVATVDFRDRRVVKDVELKLFDGAYIAGTVTTQDGKGIPGRWINCERTEGDLFDFGELMNLSEAVMDFYYEMLDPVNGTGPDGAYTVGPLPPGTYTVTVGEHMRTTGGSRDKPPPKTTSTPPSRQVVLPPGRTVPDVNFVLTIEKRVTVTVSGKVVDNDGKPIPNARVERVPTADDGTFVLTGVEPGACRLDASASGFLRETVRVSAPADDVTITLRRAGVLTVNVLDATTGEPVEDYRILFCGPAAARGRYEPGWVPVTLHDDHPEGRCEIGGLLTGFYKVMVSHPHFAPAIVSDIQVEEGTQTTAPVIKLVAGTVLTLRITSAIDGRPLPRALVESFGEHYLRHKTAADGTVTFKALAAGSYTFSIQRTGYAEKEVTVTIAENEKEKTVEIVLDTGLIVHGRVVTGAQRHPVTGALVRMSRSGRYAEPFSARTDRNGAFSFEIVPPGQYVLTFEHPRFAREEITERFDEGSTPRLTIELTPGGSVTGSVVTRRGKPVPDLHVECRPSEHVDKPVTTDDQGRFRLVHLPPGRYEIGVQNTSGAWHHKLVKVLDGIETRAHFTLGGAAVGGVVTRNGKPLPAKEYVFVKTKPTSTCWARTVSAGTMLDERGRYRFDDLPPGTYLWRTRTDAPGGGSDFIEREFRIATADLTLDVELNDERVSGVVLTDKGIPIANARVWLKPDPAAADVMEAAISVAGLGSGLIQVRHNGEFALCGVRPGRHLLYVTAPACSPQILEIEKRPGRPLSDLVIRLLRQPRAWNATLAGRVRTADGRPLDRIALFVFDEKGRRRNWDDHLVEVENNQYSIDLAPGRRRILARAEGYAPISTTLTVPQGKRVDLDLDFTAGHTITVTVTDTSGKPIEDAFVLLDPGRDPWLATTLTLPDLLFGQTIGRIRGTGPDGSMTLTNIPDGDYTLRVRASGYDDGALKGRIAGKDETAGVVLKRPSN